MQRESSHNDDDARRGAEGDDDAQSDAVSTTDDAPPATTTRRRAAAAATDDDDTKSNDDASRGTTTADDGDDARGSNDDARSTMDDGGKSDDGRSGAASADDGDDSRSTSAGTDDGGRTSAATSEAGDGGQTSGGGGASSSSASTMDDATDDRRASLGVVLQHGRTRGAPGRLRERDERVGEQRHVRADHAQGRGARRRRSACGRRRRPSASRRARRVRTAPPTLPRAGEAAALKAMRGVVLPDGDGRRQTATACVAGASHRFAGEDVDGRPAELTTTWTSAPARHSQTVGVRPSTDAHQPDAHAGAGDDCWRTRTSAGVADVDARRGRAAGDRDHSILLAPPR